MRGLVAGLLLASSAFAVTAAFTDALPDSVSDFVRMPKQFLARMIHGTRESMRDRDPNQHEVVPLGPVWLPTHVNSQSRQAAEPIAAPAGLTAKDGEAAVGGPVYPWNETYTIGATPAVYPRALYVANYFPRNQIKVKSEGSRLAFEQLCDPNINGTPQMVELPRRITADEFRNCNRNGPIGIGEFKVGYEAIALARARLYGPLRLSARDLFLALARRIPDPDPSHPETLIDNPNTSWNQVDPSLPYDRIRVTGPAPDSAPGKLATDLLLEAGCNTYPWIAALRDHDEARYEKICKTLRDDGVYQEGSSSAWGYTENLAINPTMVGIFSLYDLQDSSSGAASLVVNPVDGVEPTPASVAAGSYPLSRPIYLYAHQRRIAATRQFDSLIGYMMGPPLPMSYFAGFRGPNWGFVQLDAAERAATVDAVQHRRNLQF
jgi:phosphate transport system substrate-binding protein